MSAYELPANIKQIGSIGEGMRIYVEDYVCTYLNQYAEVGGYDERIAFLVGRYMVIDGQDVLFISGAVAGKYCVSGEMTTFTERSMEYADEMIEKYFNGLEIVGWMQSQPSYGVFLNAGCSTYHTNIFKKDYHVIFVLDHIEKATAFYTYEKGTRELTEALGYFIYYEKNRGMHEYMLENKAIEINYKPLSAAVESKPDYVEDVRKRQAERSVKRTTTQQKRTANLLVSLSAVMFIICFIMGAGLMQNQDRISILEAQLTQLSTSYKNLFVEQNKNNIASVFASEDGNGENQAGVITEDGLAQAEEILARTGASEPPATEAPVVESASTQAPATETPIAQTPATQSPATQAPVTQAPATSAPEAQAVETSSTIPDSYTVERGDNLSHISTMFYGSPSMVSDIMSLNGIDDPDKIFFGQVLLLPRK